VPVPSRATGLSTDRRFVIIDHNSLRFSGREGKHVRMELELFASKLFRGVQYVEFDGSLYQGYAYLPQTASGLHMRQRSRAFIVADASNSSNRFVFINAGQSAFCSLIRNPNSIVTACSRVDM
jgi:hypothetical protein